MDEPTAVDEKADRTQHDEEKLSGVLDDGTDIIFVSNRQPYRHEHDGGEVTVNRPTGGLTEGLDAAIRSIDGSWVAWGDGDADKEVVDDDDSVVVPPEADDEEQYTLERIWLSDEQVDDYYYGFSNQVLWPVCHSALTQIDGGHYWDGYVEVNERFADAVESRASAGDIVWIQDYHFGLMPRQLRSRLSDDVTIAHFWHIPWPGWDTFRACPHTEELIRGLLGNDLFVVHTPRYRENFLRCVDAAIPEADIDWERGRIFHRDGVTTVEAFPLGVDTDRISRLAAAEESETHWSDFAAEHGIDDSVSLAVSVDRLDYTKGIPERLDALEHLWETRPEWRGELTFVQIGTESRSQIPAYQELQNEVADAVERINDRFGTDDWKPVVYTTDYLSNEQLYSLYRNADVGIVSPIRDGMNLVAQEFIAAQGDDDGALVLSEQAGVHDVFGQSAISVSPQNVEDFSSSIHTALTLSDEERKRRMEILTRETVEHDVTDWIVDVVERMARIRDSKRQTTDD